MVRDVVASEGPARIRGESKLVTIVVPTYNEAAMHRESIGCANSTNLTTTWDRLGSIVVPRRLYAKLNESWAPNT